MNDQHYEEDGTGPLPGNGAQKPEGEGDVR